MAAAKRVFPPEVDLRMGKAETIANIENIGTY